MKIDNIVKLIKIQDNKKRVIKNYNSFSININITEPYIFFELRTPVPKDKLIIKVSVGNYNYLYSYNENERSSISDDLYNKLSEIDQNSDEYFQYYTAYSKELIDAVIIIKTLMQHFNIKPQIR